MIRHAPFRLLPIVLILVAAASLGLTACQAATEVKQGALNEFCNNRDSDCREGLICQQSVCVMSNPMITDACRQVCEKINTCGLRERANCLTDCSDEIANWGASVIDTFAQCVVSDLTCSELGSTANDAAQTCYDRLPLNETRLRRCRDLVNSYDACRRQADVETSRFQSECIYRARTASDDNWSKTDACAEAVQFGSCDDSLVCINEVFSLTPSNL